MARTALILAVLAVVLNVQCFGVCIAEQPKTCHQTQKKSIERCEHSQLLSEKSVPSLENPLEVTTFREPAAPLIATAQTVITLVTQSQSPPSIHSIAILKI